MQTKFLQVNGSSIFTVSNNIESNKSILLLHGYAEHIMRYQHFMERLTDAGFRVMGYDCKGHGQSSGKRAIISSFDQFADDLHAIATEFFREGDDNFIFGHSMGALVQLLYLQKYSSSLLKGSIVTGPAVKMYEKPPYLLEKLAPIIAALIPSFPAASLDSSTVSRDLNEVKKYDEDPLVFRAKTKAKLGHEFLKAQKKAIAQMSLIDIPILINHGSDDQLIHPESAHIVYNNIKSEDKTIKIWEGLYHELLNEPEKEEVIDVILDWIDERLV